MKDKRITNVIEANLCISKHKVESELMLKIKVAEDTISLLEKEITNSCNNLEHNKHSLKYIKKQSMILQGMTLEEYDKARDFLINEHIIKEKE